MYIAARAPTEALAAAIGGIPDTTAGIRRNERRPRWQTRNWSKLLRFTAPRSSKSLYFGGGLGWSTANLDNASTYWEGSGLEGELTAGYEVGRASTIRVFVQTDVGLPFYELNSTTYTYSNMPPYMYTSTTDRRYAPSVSVSLGIGWQRGGR